jgi:hypothetical protein
MSYAVPLVDPNAHDADQVRMIHFGGKLQDHPVAQARYGLHLMEAYRITGTLDYLTRAKRQAQRLIDRRIVERGGWFYPYPFRYGLHRVFEAYDPPWFSMMAQGQALSLFCRLSRVTGELAWRQAADTTFASFMLKPVAGRPWGVYVVDGLLWLEEYANPRRIRGDRTYNGHTFAAYGLWDYWVLSRNPNAKLLLKGALTTTHEVSDAIRVPRWLGTYCLTHGRGITVGYHSLHIGQHLQLYAMTGDPVFARHAEQYYADFPPDAGKGTVMLAAGRHTGYRFDAAGQVVDTKTVTVARRSSAPSTGRVRVRQGSRIWHAISGGSFAGYHLPEVAQRSYRIGTCAIIGYRIPRPGRVAVAPVRAYAVDDDGRTTSEATAYRVGDRVTVEARAVLNGVVHLRLDSGPHAGRWVTSSAVAVT